MQPDQSKVEISPICYVEKELLGVSVNHKITHPVDFATLHRQCQPPKFFRAVKSSLFFS